MAELVPDEESRMRRRRRRGASWIRRSARSFWHAAPCCPKKTRARRRHARQMGSDRAIGATPTARFSPGGLPERQGLAFEREFAHGKREPGRRVGLSEPVGLWRKVEAQKHPRAIGGPVQLHQSARLVDKTCALVKLYRPPDGARMLLGFDLAPETYGFREPDTTARLAFPVCEFSLEGEALPLR